MIPNRFNHKRRFELSLALLRGLQAEEYQSINCPKLLLDIIHNTLERFEEGEAALDDV